MFCGVSLSLGLSAVFSGLEWGSGFWDETREVMCHLISSC